MKNTGEKISKLFKLVTKIKKESDEERIKRMEDKFTKLRTLIDKFKEDSPVVVHISMDSHTFAKVTHLQDKHHMLRVDMNINCVEYVRLWDRLKDDERICVDPDTMED